MPVTPAAVAANTTSNKNTSEEIFTIEPTSSNNNTLLPAKTNATAKNPSAGYHRTYNNL
jgi:hypothetical protein